MDPRCWFSWARLAKGKKGKPNISSKPQLIENDDDDNDDDAFSALTSSASPA
jgi:hypothetical protein